MDSPQSINELFHKEKYQKKNNMTKGQIDNLEKYANLGNKSNVDLTIPDKLISREARYIKNIEIDTLIERLASQGLLLEKYEAWYFKVCHTLGVAFVSIQADKALNQGRNPQALFHFLINKAMNKSNDPFMPRFSEISKDF